MSLEIVLGIIALGLLGCIAFLIKELSRVHREHIKAILAKDLPELISMERAKETGPEPEPEFVESAGMSDELFDKSIKEINKNG